MRIRLEEEGFKDEKKREVKSFITFIRIRNAYEIKAKLSN